jgi:hypothetical protein
VYLGAGVLGKVGGEMVLTDPFVARTLLPSAPVRYAVEAVLALALFLAGFAMKKDK